MCSMDFHPEAIEKEKKCEKESSMRNDVFFSLNFIRRKETNGIPFETKDHINDFDGWIMKVEQERNLGDEYPTV